MSEPRTKTKTEQKTATPPDQAKRRIGRPGAGESAVGREVLIEKTCELLRTMRPDHVTLAGVARHSGVNTSLLKYYFRDRATLITEATQKLLSSVQAAVEAAASKAGATSEDILRARVAALVEVEVQNPFIHRLMVDEVLGADDPNARQELAERTRRNQAFYERFLEGDPGKREYRDVDPLFLFLAIVGMCSFFASGAPILRAAIGEGVESEGLRHRYADFVADLVLNGIRK